MPEAEEVFNYPAPCVFGTDRTDLRKLATKNALFSCLARNTHENGNFVKQT